EVISDNIREVDICSRFGGEEFAIMLAGAAPEAAHEFAERLRRRIAATTVVHGDADIVVTVSIGIAVLRAGDDNADAALVRADRALYKAKEAGRDRVESVAGDSQMPDAPQGAG